MKKLHFRYGAMNAGKTMDLLAVAHNYQSCGKKILLVKPKQDTRFGSTHVTSRTGLSRKADLVLENKSSDMNALQKTVETTNPICVLVDEVQFFSKEMIDGFRALTQFCTFLCWGLKTDFQSCVFEGSKRLIEVADILLELKTICAIPNCSKKADFNARVNTETGKIVLTGNQIEIENKSKEKEVQTFVYKSLCAGHYFAK